MKSARKKKADLVLEIEALRSRVAELEKITAEGGQAEQSLRESEAKFRLVTETIQDVFWMSTPGVKEMLYVSPAYEILWGRSRDSLYQSPQSYVDAIHPDDRQRVQAAIKNHEQGEYEVEYRVIRPDGSMRWIRDRGFPIRDGQGELLRMTGVASDITDLKLIQEKLDQRREHLEELVKDRTADLVIANKHLRKEIAEREKTERALKEAGVMASLMANALPALIAYVGADLRYRFVNAAYEEWFGVKQSEAIGRYVWEILDESVQSFLRPQFETALSGESITYEAIHRHRTKGMRTNQTTLVPHCGPDGAVSGFYMLSVDVTERKRSEEALRKSEEQLRLLTDSLPVLISYVDTNQCYRFNNKSYETWFGYRSLDIHGKHIKEVLGEAAYETVRDHVEAALSGRHVSYEGCIPYKKGERREVRCNYIPDLKDGKVRGFFALIQDITERRQYENVLQATTESLAQAQRIAHLGNWDWNIVTNELVWSDEIYRIFGLTPREFGATYEAFLESLHPDDREMVKQRVNQALYENVPYSIDYRIVRRDGSVRIVHEQAEVVFEETGRAIRMIGTVQDITERKEAEQKLEERLRFEQLISDLATRFVNVASEAVDSEIERALKQAVEFLGLDRGCILAFSDDASELRVTHCYALPGITSIKDLNVGEAMPWLAGEIRHGEIARIKHLPVDFPEGATRDREYILQEGLKSHIALPLVADGKILWALRFDSFKEDADWSDELIQRLTLIGQIFAHALMRKRVEENARLLRQQLTHMTRVSLMGELTASLAHELNQPLTAILSNAQVAQRFLADGLPDLEELREILADIVSDDRRAGEVIRKLRSLLKKGEPENERININDVVDEVIGILKSEAILKGVSIEVEAGSSLAEVRADRVQIQQVLMNLILNASEAMEDVPEPEFRKVAVQTGETERGGILVRIRDFGTGLGEGNPDKFFEPFHTTKKGGLGMGLAISRSIVEAHGGKIRAENNCDRGATFLFTLPADSGGPDD